MDAWPCPECGEEIPDMGMSSQLNPPSDPKKQYVSCPNCGTKLERQPDALAPIDHLRAWYPVGKAPNPPT